MKKENEGVERKEPRGRGLSNMIDQSWTRSILGRRVLCPFVLLFLCHTTGRNGAGISMD